MCIAHSLDCVDSPSISKNMPTRALSEIHEVILVSVFPDQVCSRHVLTSWK